MIDVRNLSPCSWRNAAVGWRAHTEESCVRRSGLPVQIIHTYTRPDTCQHYRHTKQPQRCSSSCFNLHLTFDHWTLTPAEPCSPSTMTSSKGWAHVSRGQFTPPCCTNEDMQSDVPQEDGVTRSCIHKQTGYGVHLSRLRGCGKDAQLRSICKAMPTLAINANAPSFCCCVRRWERG